ncbi:hypothetical protein BC829DRAFT_442768 [Chytridium lagenaria]|nr:hypothetical protein BC829DRAFT_442768 [Chytridium lagenaria]
MASVTSNAPTATVTRIVTATASALADPLIYSQFNVNRISIKNRTSTVAILSFLFMFVQQLGVIIQFLPDVSIIPKNDRISIWVVSVV